MERWRSFFSKAGEDVWTIIEQAILLAAHDHPRDFKEKRCEIAEVLFATRPRPTDLAATRPSASVITNCTYGTDVGEARDDEHASAACTNIQAVRVTREDGSDAHASISTIVCNIKEALADCKQPDGSVLHGLQKLESLHISVDVLKETEIGKQVNNLRKHRCKEISLLAKLLVRRWKELVDDWVNRPRASGLATSEGNNVGEGGVLSKLDEETHFFRDFPEDSQQHFYSDLKCRESYLEAPEERGSSSRAELGGLDMVGRLEKPRSNARTITHRELLEDEKNIGANQLIGGKIYNGKVTALNSSYGLGKFSSDDTNASKLHGDYGSQRQKQSKPTTNHKSSYLEGVHSESKLNAASKRKLPQDGLIETENGKRQHLAHPSRVKDYFQVGLRQSKALGQNCHWNQARK
ncbi:hypothetical protein L7F22_057064 [Adiantum nelumboides]|nr:hypothetical protein [Adiantum nelumboides]